ALVPARPYTPIYVHASVEERDGIEPLVRAAVRSAPERPLHVVADDRAVARGGGKAETWNVVFAGQSVGALSLASTARGLSRDDQKTLALVTSELAGPLQMCALYEDAQRLAT